MTGSFFARNEKYNVIDDDLLFIMELEHVIGDDFFLLMKKLEHDIDVKFFFTYEEIGICHCERSEAIHKIFVYTKSYNRIV